MLAKEITFTRGKLWIGASPQQWLVNSDVCYQRVIKAEGHGARDEITACLHLRFLGGLSHSGTLGFTYKGSSDDKLVLRVPVINEDSNAIYVGLTEPYAACVLQESELTLNSSISVRSGELCFNYAQRHPVDSNQYIFTLLTRVLISILDTRLDRLDRNTVDEMVASNRKYIQSRRKN